MTIGPGACQELAWQTRRVQKKTRLPGIRKTAPHSGTVLSLPKIQVMPQRLCNIFKLWPSSQGSLPATLHLSRLILALTGSGRVSSSASLLHPGQTVHLYPWRISCTSFLLPSSLFPEVPPSTSCLAIGCQIVITANWIQF